MRDLIIAMRAAHTLAGPVRAVITAGGALMMVICARSPPVWQRWSTTAPTCRGSFDRRPGRGTVISGASAAGKASICSSKPAAAAATSGPAFHDLVVEKCVLTAGLGEGNNFGGKGLRSQSPCRGVSEIAARRALSHMCEPCGCHDVSHELKYVCLLLARHWCSRLCHFGANLRGRVRASRASIRASGVP